MEKITIIIPCKEVDAHTKKCVEECLKLDYHDFEIIVLPDKFSGELVKEKRLKIIETGKVKPSTKRNIGMEKGGGEFFAFIDSDAFPQEDWLKNAIKYFDDSGVGIVGGPNLTPKRVNFWEEVSGLTLSNFFVSGEGAIRYKKAKNQFSRELPSCNYIARKEASSKYDSKFLTAEDSQFCFDCIKKGYEILYANDVVVYHHRRDSLSKHLKQMFIYGRDIAWLTKANFSFDKIYYSLLSVFVLGYFVLSFISIFSNFALVLFLYLSFLYLIIMISTSIHGTLKISFAVLVTSVLTHFFYGVGWMDGIIRKQK